MEDDELDAAYASSPDVPTEGPEPALVAGVAAAADRPVADVVAVLRDAVEQVVVASLGVELTWTTVALTPEDVGSARTPDYGRRRLDWDLPFARTGPLDEVTLVAQATAMLPYPWHPKATVAVVRASFPQPDGPRRGLTVALSVHRWAMYGGGEVLTRPVGLAQDWLLRAADRLDASTGFLTLDRITASSTESPWERVTAVPAGSRDVAARLWGHGWGTLLAPAHLEKIGGVVALEATGLGQAHAAGGGRVWFTLDRDLGDVTHEDVAALRRVLLPALPAGRRTPEEFRRELEEYGAAEPDYLV